MSPHERLPDPGPATPAAEPDATLAARREHSLMALVELGRALDLRLPEGELAQLALFNLVGHFGAPHAGLWLRGPGGGPLEATATVGLPKDAAAAIAGALGALPEMWPEGEVVRLDRASWLGEAAELARRSGLSALARLEGQHDWLGFVGLADSSTTSFTDAVEHELFGASLGIVAAAIENGRLVRDLRLGQERLADANERMQELDRVRSEMLQNLNHEFRTPIAAILGATSCLREPGLQDAHRQRFLEMIERQAAQARDMITMLLDHAELMSVRAQIRCEPVEVGACIRRVVAARARALADAKREVALELEPETLLAEAEAERLARVIDELLTNAIKFSPGGSLVTVRAWRRAAASGAAVVVEVVDRGRGMTPEELAFAFEPFRQADGSTTRTSGGLGIGLGTVRRILELMGGAIAVESEFGRGTTARLELRAA